MALLTVLPILAPLFSGLLYKHPMTIEFRCVFHLSLTLHLLSLYRNEMLFLRIYGTYTLQQSLQFELLNVSCWVLFGYPKCMVVCIIPLVCEKCFWNPPLIYRNVCTVFGTLGWCSASLKLWPCCVSWLVLWFVYMRNVHF